MKEPTRAHFGEKRRRAVDLKFFGLPHDADDAVGTAAAPNSLFWFASREIASRLTIGALDELQRLFNHNLHITRLTCGHLLLEGDSTLVHTAKLEHLLHELANDMGITLTEIPLRQ